jgi:MerR family redox-sensitive transcriptional activator SoxR
MTIGQVAGRLGVRPSALRYYERIGVLPPIERVNGQRRYGPAVLSTLAVIDVAKRAGFTMREIRGLLSGFSPSRPPPAHWRKLAALKLREVDALLARTAAMKRLLQEGLRCRCARLDRCPLAARHARARREGRTADRARNPRGVESPEERGGRARR